MCVCGRPGKPFAMCILLDSTSYHHDTSTVAALIGKKAHHGINRHHTVNKLNLFIALSTKQACLPECISQLISL